MPTGYARSLTDMVRVELHWVEDLDPFSIRITESHGNIALAGRVRSWSGREGAVRAARRVPGVRSIDVRGLKIRVGNGPTPTRAEISRAADAALRWHLSIPHGKVHARVTEGSLVLEGTVARACDRVAAEEAVKPIEGVGRIEDRIEVREDAK